MPASVQPEFKSPSRRALLAGMLGGIGAWAASTIGRPNPTSAADGDPILAGLPNLATVQTSLSNTIGGIGFSASSAGSGSGVVGSSSSGIGVYGSNFSTPDKPAILGSTFGSLGVMGKSGIGGPQGAAHTGMLGWAGGAGSDTSAIGVHGESDTGIGTVGLATATTGATFGVFGRSNSPAGVGVAGRAAANRTGVLGFSGTGNFPASKAKTGVYGSAAQDSASKGVWGNSPAGHGLHGESSSGWAGYFDGRVLVNRYVEMAEMSTPSAPSSSHAKLFIRDNGSGKTQLCVRFHTGATKVLATQP